MATKKKEAEAKEVKKTPKKPTVKVTVNAHRLNIRKAPSLTAPIVKVVDQGEKLDMLEDKGEWIKVKGGYVKAEFVAM
jgi:uncharacterized protein YgiM (DUF1202 family)